MRIAQGFVRFTGIDRKHSQTWHHKTTGRSHCNGSVECRDQVRWLSAGSSTENIPKKERQRNGGANDSVGHNRQIRNRPPSFRRWKISNVLLRNAKGNEPGGCQQGEGDDRVKGSTFGGDFWIFFKYPTGPPIGKGGREEPYCNGTEHKPSICHVSYPFHTHTHKHTIRLGLVDDTIVEGFVILAVKIICDLMGQMAKQRRKELKVKYDCSYCISYGSWCFCFTKVRSEDSFLHSVQ